MSTKLLLRPPDHFHSFTLYGGCGQPHECDGELIDCAACVQHVATLPADERIAIMSLRGELVVRGDTDEAREAYSRALTERRDRASFRLEEAPRKAAKDAAEGDSDEVAALKARIAELEAGQEAPPKKKAVTAKG